MFLMGVFVDWKNIRAGLVVFAHHHLKSVFDKVFCLTVSLNDTGLNKSIRFSAYRYIFVYNINSKPVFTMLHVNLQ